MTTIIILDNKPEVSTHDICRELTLSALTAIQEKKPHQATAFLHELLESIETHPE